MDTSAFAYDHVLRNMYHMSASPEAEGGAVADNRRTTALSPLFWVFRFIMTFISGHTQWRAVSTPRQAGTAQDGMNRKRRRMETRVVKLSRVPMARRMDVLLRLRPAFVRTAAQFMNWAAGLYLLGRVSFIDLYRWSSRKAPEAFMALSGVINWNAALPAATLGGLSSAQLPPD